MEAKRVLESLSVINESAKKLLVDSLFVQCLDEAIEAYWKSTDSNKGVVAFSVHSSGDIIYEGIAANSADSGAITIDIKRVEKEDPADPVKVREFVTKSAEDLIGTLTEANNKSRTILENMEIASKAGEIDLMTKKRKLLDKLLESK